MSIEVKADGLDDGEGPGVAITEDGKFRYSSYDNAGKKLTSDEARIRDEANEFFLRNHKNIVAAGKHRRTTLKKDSWFKRIKNWFVGSGTEWKD